MTFVVDTGGSTADVTGLTIIAATCPAFIRNLLAVFYSDSRFFNGSSLWFILVTEFLFIILPLELIVTVLNQQSLYISAITSVIIVCLILIHLCNSSMVTVLRKTEFLTVPMKTAPFISYFRAYTNIFTGLSIFAVDFVIYPSYFLKSRAYGTTLMDTGLGFYMISNAIVSKEARGVVNTKNTTSTLLEAIKEVVPLIVFGILRFYGNGAVDHHVPIQEYGVHWNFFFTLAAVKCLSTIIFCITPKSFWSFLWLVAILPYQYCLSATRLFSFVFFGFSGTASRDGFLEANREGIVSSVGYLAVYFVGVQLGRILFRKRATVKDWLQCSCQMICIFLISWALMMYTGDYIQKPSRKLANVAYLFFMTGVSSLLMVEGMIFDIIITCMNHLKEKSIERDTCILNQDKRDIKSPLLMAVNYNGLLFFVVANLMTGTVSLTVDTRSLSHKIAFMLVTLYMFVLSVVFIYLYRIKFSFKEFIWKKHRKTMHI